MSRGHLQEVESLLGLLLSQISERQAEMFGVLEGAVEMTEPRLISFCTRKSEMDRQDVLDPANGRKESSLETKLVWFWLTFSSFNFSLPSPDFFKDYAKSSNRSQASEKISLIVAPQKSLLIPK